MPPVLSNLCVRTPALLKDLKRRYGRIWTVIHSALDHGLGADRVVWMPAHTGSASVGCAKCSDGTVLSEGMRLANQMADLLAKDAAEMIRLDEAVRRLLKVRFKQATEVAIFLGRLTLEAGAHRLPDGRIVRDSEGLGRHGTRRSSGKSKVGTAKTAVLPDTSPEALVQRSGRLAALRDRIARRAQGFR